MKLELLVETDGTVSDANIIDSTGFDRLDAATMEVTRKCRFKPVVVDGIPRRAWAYFGYVWRLPVPTTSDPLRNVIR